LSDMLKNWDNLSEKEKQQAREMMREATSSDNNSLSEKQKEYFKEVLKTVTVAPTQETIIRDLADKTPGEKVTTLTEIIKEGNYSKPDAAAQNATAQALSEMLKNWENLSESEKQKAREMMREATSSDNNSLSDKQKEYFKEVLKTVEKAPTQETIVKELAGKTPAQKVTTLKEIIKQGGYSQPDPAAQNATAQALQEMLKNWDKLSKKDKDKARQLLQESVSSGNNSLSDKQKEYFKEVLKTVTPAPTKKSITKELAGKTPSQVVQSISEIIKQGEYSKLGKGAKNATAQALSEMLKNWDKLSESERSQAREMLKNATSKENNSLSNKQKEYFKEILKTVTPAPTQQAIVQATQGKTSTEKINNIKEIIKQGGYSKPDAAAQNATAKVLQDMLSNWNNLSDADKQKARKLLKQATSQNNNSLSSEQKEYFKEVLKTVKQAPTRESIITQTQGNTPGQNVSIIKKIIEEGQGSTPDVDGQNALASSLQDMINNWDKLTDKQRQQARSMMRKATSKDSNLISDEQKKYFEKILTSVTPAPDINIVRKVKKAKKSGVQLDILEDILQGAQGKKIDANKHFVLKAPHPSPLSVYRGFYGCKHFSQTNELLVKNGKQPIDWQV